MSNEAEIFTPGDSVPMRSYAEANRELVVSFIRYMESRHLSENTIRKYSDSCGRFVESLAQ